MARQLPQPTQVTDTATNTYLRSLVRELELRLQTSEARQAVAFGLYDYNDAATQTTPIAVTGGAGWVKLTNDTLGPQTTLDFALENVGTIWVGGTTNQFDFTGLSLGTTVDLRVDISVTTTAPNTAISAVLAAGVGDVYQYTIPVLSDRIFKSADTYQIAEYNSLYLGNTLTRNNPAELWIRADNNITVTVNGWYARVATKQ